MSNRLGVEVISCRIGEPEPLPPLPVNKQNKHTHTIYMQYIYTHIYMYTLYLYSLYTQYSSVAQSRLTLHHMDCSTPGFPVRHQLPSLLKLLSMKLVIPSNHLILCLLLLLSSIFPSIRVFSSDSVLHIRWPKYWSFSLSISPFNEYSGLISFRMDWLDLLYLYMYTFMYTCILNKREKKTLLFSHPTHLGLLLISSGEGGRLEDGGIGHRQKK